MIKNIICRFVQNCIAISLIAIPGNALAQHTYSRAGLSLNGHANSGRKSITLTNIEGITWTFNNNSKFFKVDFSAEATYLAGTQNRIVLYNTDTKSFNQIEVAYLYQHSDARAKTNIKPLNEDGLGMINRLRPISYNWILSKQTGLNAKPASAQYGFIAQEVEREFPEIVTTSDTGDRLINYYAIIPMLVKSIQELQLKVTERNRLIEAMSQQLEYNLHQNKTN